MVLALASGPMALALAPVALASKVQALALRAALTIFCHHHRTHVFYLFLLLSRAIKYSVQPPSWGDLVAKTGVPLLSSV